MCYKTDIVSLFNELLLIAIGQSEEFSSIPSKEEWTQLFNIAEKQALVGICFNGIQKLPKGQTINLPTYLKSQWLAITVNICERNRLMNCRCKELTHFLGRGGFKSVVLKGQGVSQAYDEDLRELRQSGDIDIWVDGEIEPVVNYIKHSGFDIHDIHIVHATAEIFKDVAVEIHFRPSIMYNPFINNKLQSYFDNQKDSLFNLYDNSIGYAKPSISFNLIYIIIHINRHVFNEGIGLRQLLDYYFVLNQSDDIQRQKAMAYLSDLNLSQFASALMFVMQKMFGLNEKLLLCPPNEKAGKRLLEDIINGGNFGMYGKYARTTTNNQRWERGLHSLKRNWKFVSTYPGEVLWIPYFKIWHWLWRKKRGYL